MPDRLIKHNLHQTFVDNGAFLAINALILTSVTYFGLEGIGVRQEQLTAYHEAAHFVIAKEMGIKCDVATIARSDEGNYYGYTEVAAPAPDSDEDVLAGYIMTMLAGREAEMILCGEYLTSEDSSDYAYAISFAQRIDLASDVVSYLDMLGAETSSLLHECWNDVESTASLLLQLETIDLRGTREAAMQAA